mgnify:CR=1 FL=1
MKIEEAFPLLLDLYNIEFGILKNHSNLEKPIDISPNLVQT